MQLSLLDVATPAVPAFDADFSTLRRNDVGGGAWVDYCPRWLTGHQQLFDVLSAGLDWKAGRRQMYDRVVDVPRLVAVVPEGCGHPVLWRLSAALSTRYERRLHHLSAAWYRHGLDSVAPHGDRVRDRHDTLVVTVSLGQPRRFTMRPAVRRSDAHRAGLSGLDLHLGWGDLVVMGGACQATHLHGIPKAPGAGPRMSVMFRVGQPGRLRAD